MSGVQLLARSLIELLDAAPAHGAATALKHRRGLRTDAWSYARLRALSRRFAGELAARGVAPGDRVLIWATNRPEWVAAFWGCVRRGAVVVPLDASGTPDFAARVVREVAPRLAVVGEAEAPHAPLAAVPQLPIHDLEARLAGRSDATPPAATGGDALVEIVFTSGTTSEPRGVCLTHGNLWSNLAPLEAELRRHPLWHWLLSPIRIVSLLPLSHVYGQYAAIFGPALVGAQAILEDSQRPEDWVASSRRERASIMALVPRQLEALRDHVRHGAELHGRVAPFRRSLARAEAASFLRRAWMFRHVHGAFGWGFRGFVCGGAALDAHTEGFWRRLGFLVLQGYGMTEAASLVTLTPPLASRPGSIGKPLGGIEVALGPGGELLVRGSSISPGYWVAGRGPAPLADAEGWLHTGDLGERDESGQLRFRGRSKDVIVTSEGQNVYPEDLEAALAADPAVSACAVVGVEGPRGPEPVAVLRLEGAAAAVEVLERANARLAPHQRMRRFVLWPEPDLPRTSATRKVRRGAVAEAVRRTLAGAPAPTGEPLAPLARAIAAVKGGAPDELRASMALGRDLHLDSLGRVELCASLEDAFGVALDEGAVTESTTLADLQRLVAGREPQASPLPHAFPLWPQSAPARALRAALFRLLVAPLVRGLLWLRVEQRERLAGVSGPALIVANHVTMLDPLLILAALPARWRGRVAVAMEGERLSSWRLGRGGALSALWGPALYGLAALVIGAFPLPRRSGFRRSFRFAGAAMDRGARVLVFPEGRRTTDGARAPFLAGTGLLAAGLGAQVVPVRIHGLFEWTRRPRWPPRPRVVVRFGTPVAYAADESPQAISADLERRVGLC